MASGSASIMVEDETARFDFTACNACLLRASAGISGPIICMRVRSIVDNFCRSESEVDFSLDAALTRGMWSVNAVICEFFMIVMK